MKINPEHIKTAAATAISFAVSAHLIQVGQGNAIDGLVSAALALYTAFRVFPKR